MENIDSDNKANEVNFSTIMAPVSQLVMKGLDSSTDRRLHITGRLATPGRFKVVQVEHIARQP